MFKLFFLLIGLLIFVSSSWAETTNSVEEIIYDSLESACKDLKVGEKRRVRLKKEESPTTMSAYYQVERKDDKTFLIDLNVFFEPSPDYRATLTDDRDWTNKIDQAYRQRMRMCLQDMGANLKDPSGRAIQVRFNEQIKQSTYFKGPHIRVFIESQGYPTNQVRFSEDVNCPTMIHEMFHWMGLCDEYHKLDNEQIKAAIKEVAEFKKKNGVAPDDYKKAFDCRAGNVDASLMADHLEVFPTKYQLKIATCKCTKENCDKTDFKKNDTQQQACPPKYKQMGDSTVLDYPSLHDAQIAYEQFLLNSEFDEMKSIDMPFTPTEVKNYKPKSVLYRKHLDMILYPGCEDKNKDVYQCYANAYRTSEKLGGEGCLPMPKKCKGKEWLK